MKINQFSIAMMSVLLLTALGVSTASGYIIPPSNTGYTIPPIASDDNIFSTSTVVDVAYDGNSFVVRDTATTVLDIVPFGKIRKDLIVTSDSIINLDGGGVGDNVWLYNNSHANLSSGKIGEWFITVDDATAVIDGPAEMAWVTAGGNSHIDITDGVFENLLVKMNGVIVIEGPAFNLPFGPIADTDGTLTGTLASGYTFTASFERRDNGQIILVPEPASISLMLLAGVGLIKRR